MKKESLENKKKKLLKVVDKIVVPTSKHYGTREQIIAKQIRAMLNYD